MKKMRARRAIGLGLGLALSGSALAFDRVPILLYHPQFVGNMEALERDLETLHSNGFTVVPVYWLVEWALGRRSNVSLPAKPVGITFDDGDDGNWLKWTAPASEASNTRSSAPTSDLHKSGASVLREFKKNHPELPAYSPHVAIFIIASPKARETISTRMSDNWWADAQNSGFAEIYNHGMDHDHTTIREQVWDEEVGAYIPVSGYSDGNWTGTLAPRRITSYQSCKHHVESSAEYIMRKIGVWPDLFAHPMGQMSAELRNYFQTFPAEHRTVAAFCIETIGPGAIASNYLTRQSDRWCLPRMSYG